MIIYAILYLFACSFLGFQLISIFTSSYLDKLTQIAIGICFGFPFCAWIYYIINLSYPFSSILGNLQSVLFIVFALFLKFLQRPKEQKLQVQILPFYSIIFSIFIPLLFLSWIEYTGLLYQEKYTRGSAYGDLPFHLNLISSFLTGCNAQRNHIFDLLTPFFANEPLSYPFISDYFSSIIIGSFNTTYHFAIVWPSILVSFSLFVVLNRFVYEFTKDKKCTLIAPYIFLFSGGMGFQYWFYPNHRSSKTDYVFNFGREMNGGWFQTIHNFLLPQRTSLFSLPMCWSIILCLYKIGYKRKQLYAEYIFIGIFVGLLTQVQPHSIISVSEWGIFYFLISFLLNLRSISDFPIIMENYICLGFCAILIGIPSSIPYIHRLKSCTNDSNSPYSFFNHYFTNIIS